MGRHRKRDELKVIPGAWQDVPEPDASDVPKPLVLLEGDAWNLWQRIVPDLIARGVVKACDSADLTAMCEWWGRYRKLAAAYDSQPASAGLASINVQLGVAWDKFSRMASQFGLSPASRGKLKTGDQQQANKRVVPTRKRAQ